MSKPELVMLSESEMELARRIASLRNNPKVEAFTANYRVASRDDWRLHFDGARAEVACSRLVGFPVDVSFNFDGDNKRPDLYCGEIRIEVKAATHTPPILKFNALTDFVSDVVIVCYVKPPDDREASNVEVWGCISRRKFIACYKQKDFGYGARATLSHEYLSSVSVLKNSQENLAWLSDYEKAA